MALMGSPCLASYGITSAEFLCVTITRLYDDYASAERAVCDLEAAGVPHKESASCPRMLTIYTRRPHWHYSARSNYRVDRDHDGVDDRAEGAGAGATIGGAAGLLAGLGMLAIPGFFFKWVQLDRASSMAPNSVAMFQ
jgi:hypothetical protein